ncbi:Cullin-domain-containing protein [Podospora conica]|nr:Cullin-domain-containing protein [Schizothecium conicum]
MSSGKRVRPIRKPIASREATEFEPNWDLIRDALVGIHTKNQTELSFELLYRASYKIVLKKKGALLYERVKEFEETWFRDHIMPCIAHLITPNLIRVALFQAPGTSTHERRQTAEQFLRGVRDAYVDHNLSMNMIADVLMYLDRAYTSETKQPSVFTATIGLFRDHVLRGCINNGTEPSDKTIFDIINAVVLDMINLERDGDIIDRQLVRRITAMLEDLYETDDEMDDQKLYLRVFEPAYLDASTTYYRAECEKLVREADASTWLRHTQRRLAEEQDRCETTVSLLTSGSIARVVEAELIKARLNDFLAMDGSGIKAMIDNDRIDDLTILYDLVARVDETLEPLKIALQSRVLDLGFEIEKTLKTVDFSARAAASGADGEEVPAGADKTKAQPLPAAAQQTAAAIRWVDDVLMLKEKFDTLWSRCFREDLVLQSVITKSFSTFINVFARCSEFVSLFIDDNLKRGARTKTDGEVDVVLDKAITLLRYITDRDMFERYYQKHLARRLLHNKSDMDIEKDMVSRMKSEMGNHFTSKFEGMFKDMEASKDLGEGYKEHAQQVRDADTHKVEFGIHLLTTNHWPPEVMGRSAALLDEGTKGECIYPPTIKRLQDSFLRYYLKNRSGRVITWVSTAGNADIRCIFPKVPGKETGPLSKERRYDLNVNTYGMIVLMLFNDLPEGESLSFEEIQEKTNISGPDLIRTLASISIAPKSRVLAKEPASKSIKPTDRFSYNAQFVSKTTKIKAPTIASLSRVEADEERKETEIKNDQTRSHVVDAAIVRIMKQRKQMTHTELTSEVITQVSSRFKADVPLIKKRIEDLLNREFLERVDDAQVPTYNYLA